MASTIGRVSTYLGTSLSGRYRLDAQVGTGGMSTVYRAFDTVLERQVAVKLMHRDIAGHADQLERFRREARAVAQLNHPHIVQVIDAGEDDGMPYIVFEFVEGETLKDRIRRFGRLDIPESLAYAIEIARALAVAHDRGIVHRDVKPQNVLVDEEGQAKVTDFGIARTLDQEGLTADGRVLGTTDYVSPEQALGHAVTGQSDIYSLGIVLYEMLTGDVPFHGDNQVAVAMKHVREELPDIQYRRPEVSSALASVLDACTSKDLERRYQDIHALQRDLEDVLSIETARSGQATGEATQVLRTLPPQTRSRLPLRMRTSWRLAAGAAAAALVLVGVGLYVAANRTERGTGVARENDSTPRRSGAPALRQVPLKARAGGDFDPLGGDGEHADETAFVTDNDTSTTWSTETYSAGLQKDGVGIWVDAAPGLEAREIDVLTTTPGFTAEIYGATSGPPDAIDGWTKLTDAREFGSSERVKLSGERYRWYLVWITSLAPEERNAEISEIRLRARRQ
ncbi:MAG: Serine/threonine protein kinase PrkC, regulator of stationary phase [uncultured Solirubrobacteraceae bacterium]|uniref:non-specific serine/threonine protein kinase n=1 Tax=uncultured Solirubrobacteraceae bacterium TaxID=1162706 RepID=A0A6J4S2Z5_9ACTN|nr:MAG: Serine/threonine protein kinase PrkC, regulator of stationary phase [uncultured Solirubrobacteraceae bacterium]